jgi:hypothetical protein
MSNRIKEFTRQISGWIASNVAWDVVKWILSLLFGSVVTLRLPQGIIANVSKILSQIGLSALDWIIVFVLISSTIFGALSLASPLIRWIKTYILQSDRPNLVQGNEWNAIIEFEGRKVGVAMISIDNKPSRVTEKSVAYNVSARIDFYDMKDKHLLQVKCGYWTKTSPENFLADSGKKKKCSKIDFYTHETWYLPVVYKWEGDDTVYAYDHAGSIKSKKLGKLPIKFNITFVGENLKTTETLKYFLVPQPGDRRNGFWIQKR